MVEEHGKGLELLGTILATAGWLSVVIMLAIALAAILEPGSAIAIVLPMLASVIAGMALAGLGHLLRAVAQLGRNVYRLGMMLQPEREG